MFRFILLVSTLAVYLVESKSVDPSMLHSRPNQPGQMREQPAQSANPQLQDVLLEIEHVQQQIRQQQEINPPFLENLSEEMKRIDSKLHQLRQVESKTDVQKPSEGMLPTGRGLQPPVQQLPVMLSVEVKLPGQEPKKYSLEPPQQEAERSQQVPAEPQLIGKLQGEEREQPGQFPSQIGKADSTGQMLPEPKQQAPFQKEQVGLTKEPEPAPSSQIQIILPSNFIESGAEERKQPEEQVKAIPQEQPIQPEAQLQRPYDEVKGMQQPIQPEIPSKPEQQQQNLPIQGEQDSKREQPVKPQAPGQAVEQQQLPQTLENVVQGQSGLREPLLPEQRQQVEQPQQPQQTQQVGQPQQLPQVEQPQQARQPQQQQPSRSGPKPPGEDRKPSQQPGNRPSYGPSCPLGLKPNQEGFCTLPAAANTFGLGYYNYLWIGPPRVMMAF